jgi:4-hydroxy-2-oxoheptanedioate aldolase
MEQANRLKKVLESGEKAWGHWQTLPGSNVSRALARSGVDWVLVDCEHGNIDGMYIHLFHTRSGLHIRVSFILSANIL